jgi:glucose/arabinose dehydrogenase
MRRLSSFWAILCLLFVGLFVIVPTVSAAPPANFQTSLLVGSGLSAPVGMAFAPDGRLFILQRTGEIRIYKNGQLKPTNFAALPTAATGDRGLIGITFDPDFATNHYVYFWYTSSEDLTNRLVRFNAEGDVGTDGPVILYQTNQPSQELHVGGGLTFGDDGKIYVFIGDNGYSANAQNLAVPFGKVIRLNKDGSIPNDNPYVGQAGKLPEIWASGLRNPWRAQRNPATGHIFTGDVGDELWEEVNKITKGANYGWPQAEGNCNPALTNCNGLTNPTYAYNHNNLSSAVTGGPFYQGDRFPATYKGRYFFGDYARGFIKSLTLDPDGNTVAVDNFDLNAGSVVDLAEAFDGSLYYITFFPGRLYRIDYSTGNQSPVANASSDVTKGIDPLTVNFSSAGSYDPNSQPLTYSWDFGDGTSSTQANPQKTYTNKGTYTVILQVSDGTTSSEAIPIVIQVGIAPTIHIAAPTDGATYKAGDTVFYTASGTDGAGFDLHDADFTTEVVFHHLTHIHPFLGPINSKTGTFVVPTTGEESPVTWFEIRVTGNDTNGLSTTEVVNIYPEKSHFTLNTNVPGLGLIIDGKPIDPNSMPLVTEGVVGFQREIEAPMTQTLAGKVYQFTSWSDGGTNKHFITTPQTDTTYTANYVEVPSFTAQYFNNMTLSGSPALTKQDAFIDFDWGAGSPAAGINADNFSVRWSRTQDFGPGKYEFTTRTDDGVRLYIDGNLLINKWQDQSSLPHTGQIDITGGQHTIVMEYYDNRFDAVAKLSWAMIGTLPTPSPTPVVTASPTVAPTVAPTIAPTVVPTAVPTATPVAGYNAEYWNAGTGSAPVIPVTAANYTRIDPTINFSWGSAVPAPGINADHFIVRWTKTQNFAEGTYRFRTDSDDGIRVFIDNEAVINQWNDHSTTTHTADKVLTAGDHEIRVEFYDNRFDAIAKFSWTNIGPVPSVTPGPSVAPTSVPTVAPTVGPTVAPTIAPTAAPTAVPGTYTGEYFDNKTLTGVPKLTRQDAAINFTWGSGSPDPLIPVDQFSARWTRTANLASGVYRFTTQGDDGTRLYVDGNLIIDKWVNQSAPIYTADVNLTAGNHDIKFEYYENTHSATAKMSFAKIAELPAGTPAPTPVPTPFPGYVGEYWNAGTGASPTIPATAPNLTRNDDKVDFYWGSSAPDASINADHFIARWTKTQNFDAGTYTFTTQSDDGIRVYIDGEAVIDQWNNHGVTTHTGNKTLTAGNHSIRVEFYDNTHDAVAKFSWIKL